MRTAVIHGRFQPLHVGHVEYLLAGKARCDLLIVGITNPDPWQTKAETTDPSRSEPVANPCTFYERYLMVEGMLLASGVSHSAFHIVPFPHSFPERLCYYAPRDAEYLLSIYDEWGVNKLKRLQDLGLQTHVLWRRTTKVTSGSAIRKLIAAAQPWTHLVPDATARVIRECAIDVRIRELMSAARSPPRALDAAVPQAS